MKNLINTLSKYWHPKNTLKDPISTGVGLVLLFLAIYAYVKEQIGFQDLVEAVILFVGFCGVNLTHRNAPPAAMLVLALLSVWGCKRPVSSTKTVITDSTYTHVHYVHDTVIVPGDSVKLVISLPCDSIFVPYIPETKKSQKAKITVRKTSKGKLQVDCTCAEYEAIIKAQHKTIHRLRREKTDTHTVKYVRYTAWYDWLARLLAAMFIGIIIYNLLRLLP